MTFDDSNFGPGFSLDGAFDEDSRSTSSGRTLPLGAHLDRTPRRLTDYVAEANATFQDVLSLAAEVFFVISSTGDTSVVRVVDRDSGETIREIRAPEFVEVYRKLEACRGALFSEDD